MSQITDPSKIALFIEEQSINWVETIQTAQTDTAKLNDILAQKLMALYNQENASLSKYINELKAGMKKWTKGSVAEHIQAIGMQMNVAQKEWDNAINNVQTTTQQESSQMQAQGNDAQQATTAAGLMANLMQIITSLLQNSL